MFFSTYTVVGAVRTGHPNKLREDYTLNPCQAIQIPDGQEKKNCVAGTWVCQDAKIVPEEGDPITYSFNPIAGSVAADDKVPARDVAPMTARAAKIDDVKECKTEGRKR